MEEGPNQTHNASEADRSTEHCVIFQAEHNASAQHRFDNIEEQIALDRFINGDSERSLLELFAFARAEGITLDEETAQHARMRVRPFEVSPEGFEGEITYLGAIDPVVDIGKHYNLDPETGDGQGSARIIVARKPQVYNPDSYEAPTEPFLR